MIRTHTEPAPTSSLLASSRLVVGRAHGTVVVSLYGDLDGSGSAYLAAVLDDLIEGQGNRSVMVDLGELRRIDRTAVEVLVVAAHHIGRRGGCLGLARPSADLAEVLAGAGLAGLVLAADEPPRSPLSTEVGSGVSGLAPDSLQRPRPTELKSIDWRNP